MSHRSALVRRPDPPTTIDDGLPRTPHPGEALLDNFPKPLDLSQAALAKALRVPLRRINDIVHGKRPVIADTDLRLARYFGLPDGMFLAMQAEFDLMEQRRKTGAEIDRVTPHARAASS